jgi:threonine dehydrogenase-like Zn-dependent dehydrogenase
MTHDDVILTQVHGVFAYTSTGFERALRAIESNSLKNISDLVTHQLPLSQFEKAFDLLRTRSEPIVKIVLLPEK